MKSLIISAVSFALLVMFSFPAYATTPTVSSTVPGSAATGVALTSTIRVTFNTAMKTSTMISTTFYLLDPLGNVVATNTPVGTPAGAPTTWTITPTSNLSPCSTYTIKVTTSAQSSDSSTSLAANFSRNFSTVSSGSAPTITSTVPAAGATGVNESSPITVTFDRMMDTSTITATSFGLNNGATGNISFTSANSKTTAVYTPSPNLVSTTLYTATIDSSISSLCSVALSAGSSWNFTTRDVAAPYITSTAPSNGAVNITQGSPISINFNEAMQALSSSNITVYDGVNPVAGTVTFDNVSKLTATFTPTALLNFNTLYTVTVTGARDLTGNVMSPSPSVFTFTSVAQELMRYCNIPAFVSTDIMQPNVMLIMDNSNSMDEDFNGAAVGSYSPLSKSVAGKTALRNVVQTYSDSMRIGLMTYNLPSVNSYYVSNSPYFASYEPKSWCQNPPSECQDYCATGDGAKKTVCHDECILQNPVFDETYMDEVITAQGAGARRTKYCNLVYPKTSRMVNPSDTSRYVYYKQALPFYSSGVPGNEYDYAQNYTPTQEIVTTGVGTDSYNRWTTKTGTNDDYGTNTQHFGYSGGGGTSSFTLTDSDLALGYGNIGRRMTSVQIGRTWFASGSPGDGYLQIPAATNDAVNTQKNLLLTKLTTYSGNATGYMSCTSTGNPNTCSYIVNAGLTPTAGTLQTATDYFTGSSSPIQQRCQKNFIIYVTDGLPSVNSAGTVGNATTLIGSDVSPAAGTVLNKLDNLHSISKTISSTAYNFNVKTYVLGLGLTSDAKAKLELMAQHGGTVQAYYADNLTQLSDALEKIFRDINAQISSGTSASIVNNRGESGANLFQAVFYPKKTIGTTDLYWIGEIQNLWYYLDPLLGVSSIREDTDFDRYLDMTADDKVTVEYDPSTSSTVANWFTYNPGTNSYAADATANARTPLGSPDNIHPLWRAGSLLHLKSAAARTIYSVMGSYNTGYLNISHSTPSSSSSGLSFFDSAGFNATSNITPFNSYLNVPDATTGLKVVNYIRGVDDSSYRSRAVAISYPATNPAPLSAPLNALVPAPGAAAGVGIWKLGDIVSSTPMSLTAKQLHAFDTAYNDSSYSSFYNTYEYNRRNMVFVGANDGMLHAFKVGLVTKTAYNASTPYRIAQISNIGSSNYIGDEEWAFIPMNALPYLKYLGDPAYAHIYYVNNTVSLFDLSVNKPDNDTNPSCSQAEYWKCGKKTTYTKACSNDPSTSCSIAADCGAGNQCNVKKLDADNTSWRTILIGGMGLGGASRDKTGFCNKADGSTPVSSATETRFDCVKSPVSGNGLSSFFALDVTNPVAPKFMWEFSDAILPPADKGLGYSTSGPAVVRISTKSPESDSYGTPNLKLNGRWFAVFATGPSGPIDTTKHQFMGRSDNRLKVYVVDIHPDLSSGWLKNKNYWVFDSGIDNAFAGDLNDAVVDVDRWNSSSTSYYSDDVVYIGYTRTNATPVTATTTWSDGGVLRLLTNDSIDPVNWSLSKMIDGVGPVTSAVTKLQDRKDGKLWTYFGSGRYFYKNSLGGDDPINQRYIMGVQDTCYNGTDNTMNAGYKKIANVWTKQGCGVSPNPTLGFASLQDQSTSISTQTINGTQRIHPSLKGWYIQLDPAGTYSFGTPMVSSSYDAERVITNSIANFNGLVLFTTFMPSDDICSFGGAALEWIVDYGTGGVPPDSAMKGKLLIQLSSGQFVTINISDATKSGGDASQKTRLDRRLKASLVGQGLPGGRGGSFQSPSQPVRKILHIMER